ncbi:LuxR C-terminal-related transcriptional regulator [Actinocrispum sp. NPDC049592]|uniref:helix-turn-helix transcriptional regulator n=1 Tax=Actinocrispum sp. NPDC049592 TaxID=3154835 RepID=UPI00342B6F36
MSGMNVVVAIGNDVVRFGIERMLQAHEAEIAAAVPDVEVVIVLLAESDDESVRRLRLAEEQGTRILVLVDEREAAELSRMSRLSGIRGAGFLTLGDLNGVALRDALMRIAAGDLPMSAGLARDLLTLTPRPRLTPREHEALVLMVEGLSNKQIARRLTISEHGAKRLVANILSKMDCPNRTVAVAKALRDGVGNPVST